MAGHSADPVRSAGRVRMVLAVSEGAGIVVDVGRTREDTVVDERFAQQVRSHFPEGLTGIIAVGGTRTSFVLSTEPDESGRRDPGKIDPKEYAKFGADRYVGLLRMFFDLGGQNLIVPVLSYQSFHERGAEYTNQFTGFARWLAGPEFQRIYRELGVDPFFCGIDTLLHLPEGDGARALGEALRDFRSGWEYAPGRRKVIWEIAPIPLYSFWRATAALAPDEQHALDAELAAMTDLDQVYRRLFQFYARSALGAEIPVPHFYLGTNRNGDLKLRAPLSLSMLCGGAFRAFYTPYPTLFLTPAALRTVIEDLISGGGLRSFTKDYEGHYSDELFRRERERVLALRDDPRSTLGLLRDAGRASAGRSEESAR